jgi:hypothetical protein
MTDTEPAPKPPAPRLAARRRLWQLPTQAHELLTALSFAPDALRREVARTMGQVHKGRCVLKGRDVDVLYSAVHDLAARNPLTEALHKRLEEKHALAVQRLAPQRDQPLLEAAWAQALADDTVPSMLWAVLTHPLGPDLEAAVLYDARHWIFTHARRSVGLRGAARQRQAELAEARLRADALQARLLTQQRQAAEAAERAHNEIARLHGELARRAALPPESDPEPELPPAPPGVEVPLPGASRRAAGHDAAPLLRKAPGPARPEAAETLVPPPRPPAQRQPSLQPIIVRGRRVLCVGGMQHAVARYRGRIEQLGGRFEHHDGGIEDGLRALDARLCRADLVICQAACINHEAYHRVKRHCERTGTPCMYLDRPSLSRFERALGEGHDARV